ncbi:MAG: hypothetical protein WBD99_16035 [Thermodesulfobacteriota bacterium]
MRITHFKRFLFVALLISCHSISSNEIKVIKQFPIDTLDDVITKSGVQIDSKVSSDGKGSLKITATKPTVVRLLEIDDIDVESATLIYRAKLKTENVDGKVYLEMWCHFPGKGEFFSRGLTTPLTGTTDWTTEETPFFLKKGEKPDYVKLNIVIDGAGTVWIDAISLLKAPLS